MSVFSLIAKIINQFELSEIGTAMAKLAHWKKWSLRLLAAPFVVILSYLLVALILGVLSTTQKNDFANETKTILIYVASNGVHLNLWLPTQTAVFNWQTHYPQSYVYNNMQWTQIGWGSKAFYTQVPTWAELTPSVAWQAITGDESVIQLSGQNTIPTNDANRRKLLLSQTEYQHLIDDLQQQFKINQPLFGYFYPAQGNYNARMTCNEWMRQRLNNIGLSMPLWSPFDKAVLWHLP